MKSFHAKPLCLTACTLLFWISTSSWGFLAHRTISQLAVYQLPGSMRQFFYSNMDYIVRHSVRADLRRSEDSTEDKRHFINFEVYGDSSAWKMPMRWDDALGLYSFDTLVKNGYVPYHIMFIREKLVNAFRRMDKDSVLFYAADIAHYIADAHVPLHTTMNYDGQLTGQNGLHSLWESMIPEVDLESFDLSSVHRAQYLKQPERSVWKALQESYSLINEMLMQERETSKRFSLDSKYRVQVRRGKEVKSYTSEFAKAYHKALGHSINNRLISSSRLVADFWYTCWVDAGRPNLNTNVLSDAQKTQLKKERKAFERNRLIHDRFLIARKRDSITQ